ncbi:GGDEF domain-containing protein [Aquabacterium sp.]|uniref:GGDEF domain-containing protein n=1 Tax=Aquabacterium sp. TaxID=1872578 RepID=UPI002BF5C67B|nr:GGDEF domain-containing protein [Aquabacterium sp.]HSW08110.1 GGDEF domain-containing protein [Aquabacterium sp.]
MSSLSPSEMAFLMLAMMQAVAAVLWGIGAWWIVETRAAALHWAAYAAAGALTFLLLATHLQALPMAGVLVALGSLMLLQRGVWFFTGQPRRVHIHLALLAIAALASWVGTDPAWRPQQAVVHYSISTTMYLWISFDLYRHARKVLRLRWPILLALPLLVAGLNAGGRAMRTLLKPEALATEIAANSTLNVGTALVVVVLVATLHATLMALVVARLVNQLNWRSRHDGLTGLLNRRAMQEAIDQQLARSRRAGDTFAVVMLDLDHFKTINDRFGHPVGDAALKHVAALLQAGLRDVDRLGRFGGEEFVVLLPRLTLAEAAAVAESLRERLSAQPLPRPEGPLPLAASWGVAEWRGPSEDESRVLLRADQALYRAKADGRNRVALAAPEPLAA